MDYRYDTNHIIVEMLADDTATNMHDYRLELWVCKESDDEYPPVHEWVLTPPHRSPTIPRYHRPLQIVCEQITAEIYDLPDDFHQRALPNTPEAWRFYGLLTAAIEEAAQAAREARDRKCGRHPGIITTQILLPPK